MTVTQDTPHGNPVIFNTTATAARQKTMGYAEIYSAGAISGYMGATLCGLPLSDTYCLRVNIDGTPYVVNAITLTPTMSWTQVAAAIQLALRTATGSTETVVISSSKILITSATSGAASAVAITDGLTHLPFIAAVQALGTAYSNTAAASATAGVDATKAIALGTIDVSAGHDFSVALTAAFKIGSVNVSGGHDFSAGGVDYFDITVDGGAVKTIDLTANCANLADVLTDINTEFVEEGIDALVEAVADSAKYVKIQTKTSGSAHHFTLTNGIGTALAVLGLGATGTTYTGTDSTAATFTINAAGSGVKTISLVGNDANLAAILLEINNQFTVGGIDALVEAVADSAKYVKIQNKTAGATNFILVDGTLTPLVSLFGITVGTHAGTAATPGSQALDCTGHFVAATVPGLSSLYTLNVRVDGVAHAITLNLAGSETWTQLAAAIDTACTAFADASVTYYRLRITSKTYGTASLVVITEGTGGRPLLAAIGSVVGYTGSLAAPVDGRAGLVTFQVAPEAPTTKDFFVLGLTVTSATKERTGLRYSYSKTTGKVAIMDDPGVVLVTSGDVITIVGAFS